MDYLDFRSDTVTHPTPAMRAAMAAAPVGDAIYGDDPTLRQLEQLAAQLLDKDAALLVPSGTFGNQLALQLHCRPGEEVLLSEQSHIVQHETGAAAALAGVQLRCIDAPAGHMTAPQLQSRIRRDDDFHHPQSSLLCLENAFSSGQVVNLEQMAEMSQVCRAAGLKVHLDGARLFNAAAHLGCDPAEIARHADTVMFCLSKGLCAPMGSLLVGAASDIKRARYLCKRMGGGLRQAGIIAAAGILGLREMRLRLAEDHQRARYLADLLEQEIPGAVVARARLDINMVFARVPGLTGDVIEQLGRENIYLGSLYSGEHIRLVCHYWTPLDAIDRLVGRLRSLLD